MHDIEEVSRTASAIEGWLSDDQGRALYMAAAATSGRGAIVEIGSWKGRSTVWLGSGARQAARRVHAIDPHAGSHEDSSASTFEAFRTNLDRAGLAGQVEVMVMTSAEAAGRLEGPVELLFVDGDHSIEGAARDADIWLPRVMSEGVVMFHDVATSGYSGPRTPRRSRAAAAHARAFGLLLYFHDLEGALKRTLRRLRRALGLYPSAVSST